MTLLKDTQPGDTVVSTSWTDLEWGENAVPSQLIVIGHEGHCVWCRPVDGVNLSAIPLFAGLPCEVVK